MVMQSELPVTKEEEEIWNEMEKKVGRPRKEDRLVITSIRLPRNVVEYFSSRGGRKQMRDVLSAYVDESNKLDGVK